MNIREAVQDQGLRSRLAVGMAFLAAIFFFSPPLQQARNEAISAAVSAYTQSHQGSVQVIVTTKGDAAPVENVVRAAGGRINGQFKDVNSFSATVPAAIADRLNHDGRVKGITINAPVKFEGTVTSATLANRYNTISRVPALAWNGKNLDGTGVQVAVIDSGVWPHDDLVQNSPYVPANTGNRLVSLYTNPLATDPLDHVGHGTHVAGIVAGNGYDSAGQYIGVAPNALIVGVKVSNDLGSANEGDVISGLEWVYQANQHGMHIRVINLSLSSTVPQSYNQSALDAMVEKLWFSGVVVVAAAGNGNGPVQFAPGNDPYVITVGSIEDYYQTNLTMTAIAPWSLTGTTQDGFNKPEVVADGSHVISLLAPLSQLSLQHPGNIVSASLLKPNYFKMGGTSMAAPQVAGLVAMMLQANPSLTPNKVKGMLRHGSVPFSTVAFTSWLGTSGGFLDAGSIGRVLDAQDNAGVTTSQSFDPLTGTILAGGTGWADASWASASWTGTSWNGTSWNGTSWNGTSWNSTQFVGTSWNGTSWNGTSWNGTSWNGTSWNDAFYG